MKPLAAEMRRVEAAGLSLTAAPPTAPPTTNSLWQTSPTVPGTSSQPNMNELIQERHRLEKFLRVLGATSREYVIQRIYDLSEGNCIAAFRWNSGVWKDKTWVPELSTDSQVFFRAG